MITHDANGGHSDLWGYIEGLREDLGRAEDRIHALEHPLRTPSSSAAHYEAAERLMEAEPGCSCERMDCVHGRAQVTRAQVHATLALVTSPPLADLVGLLTEIRDELAAGRSR